MRALPSATSATLWTPKKLRTVSIGAIPGRHRPVTTKQGQRARRKPSAAAAETTSRPPARRADRLDRKQKQRRDEQRQPVKNRQEPEACRLPIKATRYPVRSVEERHRYPRHRQLPARYRATS